MAEKSDIESFMSFQAQSFAEESRMLNEMHFKLEKRSKDIHE